MTPTPTSAVAARELAEEAKRWLSDILDSTHSDPSTLYEWQRRCASAIDRLAALAAQPAAPAVLAEPVAWMDDFGSMILTARRNKLLQSPRRKMGALSYSRPLYTHPASQARSPLTEDEIHAEITRLKDMLP